MKKMLIFGIIIVALAVLFIGNAMQVSTFIEDWSVDKLKEPDLEKAAYYNIKYVNLIGNFNRTLELIDKFNLRYEDKSDKLPELLYITALIYEKKLEPVKVRELLSLYIENYPEGKDIAEVKRKLREYKPSF